MTILTQEQTKRICERALSFSKADECIVTVGGSREGNIRFARNAVSTAGLADDTSVAVQVAFGKRQGTATINEYDDKSLEKVVRRAEDLARLAPENPEFMPTVGKQDYKASSTFSPKTDAIDPEYRAQAAAYAIEACKKSKLVAAGFFTDSSAFSTVANSNGVFGHQQTTGLDFTCTVRTEDGRGSGWVKRSAQDAARFDPREAADVAIEKALRSVDAKALEPGRYTVILEPAAISDLLAYMLSGFDARQTDEGRSFLSKQGGASRLGDKLFDEKVNIWADPWDKDVAVLPWDSSNLIARQRMDIVKNGKVNALQYSQYWAKKKGVAPTAMPGNILVAGTDKSTAELIASTKKGILVTRTWYIRMVDPQSVLLTGLTRDGTFYIENGKIKYPIKNFRFNESPVTMLNNIDEIGKPVLIGGDESSFRMSIPPMKIRDFNFTSLSDAV